MGQGMSASRVVVIGLDAATFDVIDPMISQGQLPTLDRLFRSGNRGTLRSTTHPLTTQAWTTMTTGVNAGRHGMWDFCERDASGYRLKLVNGSYRRSPTIWDRLSAAGRRVGVVNVPFTWPAREVNGFLLAGLDSAGREAGMSYPASAIRELRERLGHLEFDHAMPLDDNGVVDLEHVRRAAEQKVETVRWLADRFDPELLWVVFMPADHIHHLCWPEWEEHGIESRVAEVYRILDRAVAELVELAGPEADLLIVSDHGGGRLNRVLNINAWLAQEGFLTYVGGRRRLGSRELGRLALHRTLEQRRRLPKSVRNTLKQRFPRFRERAHELKEFTVIDWPNTRAFAYGIFGNVVLNVRGRELHGTVEPGEEYERVRDAIAERARELRDPETGESIVAAVHKREDLFHGPALAKVPDLLLEFKQYAWLGKGNLIARTPSIWDRIRIAPGSKESYVGSHRHEGIVALSGPSAAPGADLSASIEDIAPTVFYLLGEPIPDDLEGRLLMEAVDPALLEARPPEYVESDAITVAPERGYSADDIGEVEERLRGLGYIE
jgi:predicted AlkP superfamily phosphohydrolase/phosphomutase